MGFFRKVWSFILGVTDSIKMFLFNWGLKILLVLFFGMVLHNVLKMGEISTKYSGEYKHLVLSDQENAKMMNVYDTGYGEKTVVILPGFGSQSPVLQYKALVNGLRDQYRVVVIEYFGYGYSMGDTKRERSNEKIAEDIINSLIDAEIPGPYVFLAHSLSHVYTMKLQEMYPDAVQGIISLDGAYPSEINDSFYYDYNKSTITNVNITSILELSGFERVLSYTSPKTFYIDKMKEMKDVYSEEDIKLYRNRIGSSYLTRTMVKEINKLLENMAEMKDYVYPDYLHTLSILSQDRVNLYEENKTTYGTSVTLNDLANKVITNGDIQSIVIIPGDHNLNFTNPNGVLEHVRSFLASF